MPVLPGNSQPTYSPQDAIRLAQSFGHGLPLSIPQAALCDTVNSTIWTYYPWSWSQAALTAITLVQGVQDYAPDSNDTILRPVQLSIARTDTTPIQTRELDLLNNLSVELSVQGGVDSIQAVEWKAGFGIFR